MSPSNERSAEYWRGVLYGYHGSDYLRYADIHERIAAAEAREATQPTAAEVIEAADKALSEICETYSTDTLDELWTQASSALALCARWKEANGG